MAEQHQEEALSSNETFREAQLYNSSVSGGLEVTRNIQLASCRDHLLI